jgi:hypothetical protein
MMLPGRFRHFCWPALFAGLLLGSALLLEPICSTAAASEKKPPGKPRYAKCSDPRIIKFAESEYLNDWAAASILHTCKDLKDKEGVVRDELESYKQTPDAQKEVINYLEGKVNKAEKKTKEWAEAYERRKEDIAEYKKTHRLPVWIIEEYRRTIGREPNNASRP